MPKPQEKTANSKVSPQANNASNNETDILQAISNLKTEIRDDNQRNMDKVTREINGKLDQVSQELNGKLDNIACDIQGLTERMDEAESRVAQLESWAEVATAALCTSLEAQKSLQKTVIDLESRSRRNNIRIFGIPEGEETTPMPQFIDHFLKTQLHLADDFTLGIQRAHRALAGRPPPEAPPRNIIINFQEHKTKEMVLREAWKKKIKVGSRYVYFDHDYPAEIVKKRKEYNAIKKTLKEKAIRFQTPYTNIRIHWDSGTRTYNCAQDVYSEFTRRGIQAQHHPITAEDKTSTAHRLRELMCWQQAGGGELAVSRRAKAKLQGFQRCPDI